MAGPTPPNGASQAGKEPANADGLRRWLRPLSVCLQARTQVRRKVVSRRLRGRRNIGDPPPVRHPSMLQKGWARVRTVQVRRSLRVIRILEGRTHREVRTHVNGGRRLLVRLTKGDE